MSEGGEKKDGGVVDGVTQGGLVPLVLYVRMDLKRDVKEQAKAENRSMSDWGNEALRALLEERRR